VKFNRVSDWAEVSEDGRFSVAMIRTKGRYTFEAWRCGTKQKQAENLGSFPDIEQARQRCRESA
jgi:hypothetical protein